MNSKLEKISKKSKKNEEKTWVEEITEKLHIKDLHYESTKKINYYNNEKQMLKYQITEYLSSNDEYIKLKGIELEQKKLSHLSNIPSHEEYYEQVSSFLIRDHIMESQINDGFHGTLSKRMLRKLFVSEFSFLQTDCIPPVNKDTIYKYRNECCTYDTILKSDNDEMVCEICGIVYGVDLGNDMKHMSYEQIKNTSIVVKPQYKRGSHLREKIDQKLANTSHKVPTEVLDAIKTQLKKERVYDYTKLHIEDIKRILKATGNQKYYDMEHTIFYFITGVKLIEFDDHLISLLEKMFDQISEAFSEIKNKTRKSMFVYNYTIHKMLELLGLHEYKTYFKPPKNKGLVREYDLMWREICKLLDWDFINTQCI